LVVAAAILLSGSGPAAQTVTLDSVMSRATAYVATFVEKFSNVVTEERYEQAVRRPGQVGADRRQLRSDLVVIKDETPFGSPTAARWIVTTVFKPEERLGIAVPVEMREYDQWWATEVTGTATDGRFRTFNVTADERVDR
jgi:hypothetical protein